MKRCTSDDTKRFHCKIEGCDAVFRFEGDVKNHARAVHSKPVKCPYKNCKSYVKPHGLVIHIKQVHEKIMKNCGNCGKNIQQSNIKQHLDICSSNGERKFECLYDGCIKSFTTVHYRSIHQRNVHSQPIQCPVMNCNAILKPKSLKSHIKLHHPA